MREIKVRAWDKRQRQMSKTFTIPQLTHYEHTLETAFPHLARFKDLIWLEYTGLCDKNGVEVYEGHILRYTRFGWRCRGHPKDNTDLVTYYKVIWDETECAFRADNEHMTGSLCFDDSRAKGNEIEVIGNIYENPELLRKV